MSTRMIAAALCLALASVPVAAQDSDEAAQTAAQRDATWAAHDAEGNAE